MSALYGGRPPEVLMPRRSGRGGVRGGAYARLIEQVMADTVAAGRLFPVGDISPGSSLPARFGHSLLASGAGVSASVVRG
jgi:hypothetical protein